MAIPEPRGITIGKGTPQNSEGQNGDMTIRSSIRGLKLYVKESNKWHGIDLDIDLKSLVGTIQRLEKEVKRLSNKTNNSPVVDKILLRQSGGSAAIGIQNKSGNIAFRNSTDSADALINNPKIRGAQDGSDVNPVIDTQTSNEVRLAYNDAASHFTTRLIHAATDTYDNRLSFFSGASARWSLGFNADAQTTLKIAQAASLASPVLELDTNGNLSCTGDLTVTGADITVGADSDGTDRNITFGHSTLKTIMGIDDSADAFVINTDASYDGTLANNSFSIDASHNAIVAGSLTAASFNHFMDVKLHMFVTTDANQDYLPFGPSNIEGNSTGDSTNDDTLFIPPYDGKLIKLVIHHASSTGDAGATRINLRVNGSNKSFVQVTLSNETSATFDFTTLADDQVSFSAGDRVRISADPATKLSYTTASSVWRYTI